MVEGRNYRVCGEVAFRDEVPIIGVRAIEPDLSNEGRIMSEMTTKGFTLPRCLRDEGDSSAVSILQNYFAPMAGGRGFTGGRFDSFDPNGNRAESANVFNSDDLVAVTLLSVNVPPRAALELLVNQRSPFAHMLQALGQDRDLADEPSVRKEDFGPAWGYGGTGGSSRSRPHHG